MHLSFNRSLLKEDREKTSIYPSIEAFSKGVDAKTIHLPFERSPVKGGSEKKHELLP